MSSVVPEFDKDCHLSQSIWRQTLKTAIMEVALDRTSSQWLSKLYPQSSSWRWICFQNCIQLSALNYTVTVAIGHQRCYALKGHEECQLNIWQPQEWASTTASYQYKETENRVPNHHLHPSHVHCLYYSSISIQRDWEQAAKPSLASQPTTSAIICSRWILSFGV